MMESVSVQGSGRGRLKGKDVGIPVRKLGQRYDAELPKYWLGGNAFLSLLFSGFSATLPQGEAQFIHSVRLFADKVTDPGLAAQVRAFIGQEAQHGKEHRAFNRALQELGLPLDEVEEQVIALNAWSQRHYSPQQQLAVTVCAEHLTALLADYILRKNPTLLAQTAPKARAMWAWHAIEETEHKAVAFDVYDQLVGDRTRLRWAMVSTTAFLMYLFGSNALKMVWKAPERFSPRMWGEALALLGHMTLASAADYLAFFKGDFHPWQLDTRAALEAAKQHFLGETPAANAALSSC